MSSFPVPPGFAEALLARRERRRRRRRIAGAAAAVLVLAGGLVGYVTRHRSADGAARSCDSPPVPLVVVASMDKVALMTRFAADFSAGGRTATGQCVAVTVVGKGSGAAASALAKGWATTDGPQPDVWSPTGSIWLPLLEQRLAQAQRSSLVPAPAAAPRLAASPMVVAMPRPMAEALGWPDKQLGWADMLSLASAETGWGSFGHPEWGRFLLGKTNPNFSHAGLEGTVATYFAAVGRTSGLTEADVRAAATRTFVAGVEQSVIRYGDTTVSFQTDWLRADQAGQAMSYISALVTEENLVVSYNEGNPTGDPALAGKGTPPTVPLVAIYPKEGTFVADHPFAALSAPWVTPAKRAAAQAFADYLRSAPVQERWQDNHFRDAAGRPAAGLTVADGVLPAEPRAVLQPPAPAVTSAILDSWSQLRKTASVINLVDVSGSMLERLPGSKSTKLDAAKKAATASLDLFTDRDEVGLWSFSGGKRGVVDHHQLVGVGPMAESLGGTPRRAVLATQLAALKAQGDTGLYNSIDAAYRALLARYRQDRINALVVITDGRNDAQGGLSLKGLLDSMTTLDPGHTIRVITIAYGPDADKDSLAKIARATKGAAYVAPTDADIPKIYSAALSNL